MATSDARTKVIALVEKLRELDDEHHGKRAALMTEIMGLLNGGESLGPKLTRIKEAWCAAWTERHLEQCTFNHRADTAFLKEKLAEGFSEEIIIAKIHNFILSDDPPELVRARHPFGWLRKTFNTWRGKQSTAADSHSDSAAKLRDLRGPVNGSGLL